MSAKDDRILVGIDTGGTFTDFAAIVDDRLKHGKVLSTPEDPSAAIEEGLQRLGLADRALAIVHGTTVGTNAVLEGKVARVAYVTSEGFADVLTLGRQDREQVYDLMQPATEPPVPEDRCLEVSTRSDPGGRLLGRAGDGELAALRAAIDALDVDAVAINLLFSFRCAEEERRIAKILPEELFVCCSSDVLPEIREYERGIATWLNAAVGPVIDRYLEQLTRRLPGAGIAVMQSSGTTVSARHAAGLAVRLLLSGPAGGIAAARLLGEVTGDSRLMTLDMGGTSTDVALLDGGIPLTSESRIGRWPLTITTVDIHTIGAGGGSIARVDRGGLLLVGPDSAGADPGPACYGQGGEAVTVTDANLVLGRIPPQTRLGGYLPLDPEAAGSAMDRLAERMGCARLEAARGVVRIVNEHMARALRVISVERGHDPREYQLVCFGGAGGLHACELAGLLDMRKVMIPAQAGVLSAQGMLASEPGRDLSRALLRPVRKLTDEELDQRFAELESEAIAQLGEEGVDPAEIDCLRQMELRYAGQSAGIVLDYARGADHGRAFHEAHASRNGHRLNREVELVNLRLAARAPAPISDFDAWRPPLGKSTVGEVHMAELDSAVPVCERGALQTGQTMHGPAIITDPAATAWLAPDWQARMDKWGNLVLSRTRE